MDALTITIYPASEGGCLYDIYGEDLDALADKLATEFMPDSEEPVSLDGGQCTTTMLNALGMAFSQAEDLIKCMKGEECPGCLVDMGGVATPAQALSRYQHGRLCSACGAREALEGDFIGAR